MFVLGSPPGLVGFGSPGMGGSDFPGLVLFGCPGVGGSGSPGTGGSGSPEVVGFCCSQFGCFCGFLLFVLAVVTLGCCLSVTDFVLTLLPLTALALPLIITWTVPKFSWHFVFMPTPDFSTSFHLKGFALRLRRISCGIVIKSMKRSALLEMFFIPSHR